MADWFKMYEDCISEDRIAGAIQEDHKVLNVWIWILSGCCRTKSDKLRLRSDRDIKGAAVKLNLSVGEITSCLTLLDDIDYIDYKEDFIKVLQWNKLQSDYCKRVARGSEVSPTKSRKVQKSSARGEESRSEEKREESTSEKKTKRLDVKCIANVAANKKENLSYQHKLVDAYKLIVKKGITMTVEDWCTLYEYYGTTMDLPLIATDMLARHAVDPIENGYRWCFAIIRNDDTTRYSRPEKPYCPTDAEFARNR